VLKVPFNSNQPTLAFIVQAPAAFHKSRHSDWCWQGNKSTKFW